MGVSSPTATATSSQGVAAAAPTQAPATPTLAAAEAEPTRLHDDRRKHRFRLLRPLSAQGAVMLSAFCSALLASTPRSEALLVTPSAQASAALAGRHGRHGVGRTNACYASSAASVFSATRSVPPRAAAGRGCGSMLMVAPAPRSGGGEEGGVGEGEGHVEGEGALGESAVVGENVEMSQGQFQTDEERDEEEEGQEVVASSSETSVPGSAGGGMGETGGETRSNSKGSKKSKKKKKKDRRPKLRGEALRDELMRREKVEEVAVLEVNSRFYRARAYKEIDDLKDVWDKSDLSECIRSVGASLKGYNDIMEEYKTEFLLGKKQEKPGLRPFKIRNLQVRTCGTLAWVTCVEDMRNPYKPYPKTVQLVTNVFRKTSSGWRLARHHASDRDVATPKGSSGGPNVSAVLGGGGGGKQSRDGQSGNSLLSHFVDENGQVTELSARMFRVSDGEITPVDISDLNIDLSDGNGDDDDEDDDEDEITIDASVDDEDIDKIAGGRDGGGGGSNLPPYLRKLLQDKVKEAVSKTDLKAIIRRRDGPDAGGPKDAGADWEFKDGIPVSGGGGDGWGDSRRGREGGAGRGSGSRKDDDEDDEDEGNVRESRELTRETVDAVRKLAAAGMIEDKEKRLLLADVIRNASSDGPSITEVAFEVLVGGGLGREFDPTGCEEFVDQCKAFAIQLADEQRSQRRRWWKFWARR